MQRPIPRCALHGRVALGMFAPTCRHVNLFLRSCIGCGQYDDGAMQSVALVDSAPVDACDSTHVSLMTPRVLSLSAGALPATHQFQKTRALFKEMFAKVPMATWFVKADTDTLLNMYHLRLVLFAAPEPTDYVGDRLRLFRYAAGQRWFDEANGRSFTYMHGGLCKPDGHSHHGRCTRRLD